MYEALLVVHSWLRWIVLLVGAYAFARAAAGRFTRRPWAPADEAASRWFVIAVDLQVVIGLLLYLPFGKLFHIIQRPLSLGVSFYREAGRTGGAAACVRCGEDYASRLHVDDLKTVLDELGFDFRFATAAGDLHYQDVCPPCRRRLLALNQGKALGR